MTTQSSGGHDEKSMKDEGVKRAKGGMSRKKKGRGKKKKKFELPTIFASNGNGSEGELVAM